jgi:transposase
MSHSTSCSTQDPTMDSSTPFAAFVGLDRSDAKLDLCVCVPTTGEREYSTLDNTPEQIAPWLQALRVHFSAQIKAGQQVALCLEQPAGGLLYHFLNCEWLEVYAVNPMSLSRHRETLVTSRAKSDAGDAYYLMDLVRQYHEHLPIWQPGEAAIRALTALVEQRRQAVDLRTQLTNWLTAHLKSYYPQALQLAGKDLHTTVACDFLLRWPSLGELKRARAATIRQFYVDHSSRRKDTLEQRLQLIRESVPLHEDTALVNTAILTTRLLASQLKQLKGSIAEFDQQIEEVFGSHDDAFIFRSLPGAGRVYSARLLAAIGSDQERFADADALEKYSGVAPIIKQSGQKRVVQRRRAKPKFIHQSFVEYADQSIRHCTWALCFYRSQRARGKGHYAAVRALAFKWIRIIFRCWQERVSYDEEKYLHSLQHHGSPLGERLIGERLKSMAVAVPAESCG